MRQKRAIKEERERPGCQWRERENAFSRVILVPAAKPASPGFVGMSRLGSDNEARFEDFVVRSTQYYTERER